MKIIFLIQFLTDHESSERAWEFIVIGHLESLVGSLWHFTELFCTNAKNNIYVSIEEANYYSVIIQADIKSGNTA